MSNSMSFRTPLGLPTRFRSESGLYVENEFLFGLYEHLLGMSNSNVHSYYISARNAGYPNHIDPSVPETELSHDQLTAYYCYAQWLGRTKDIEELTRAISGFRYHANGSSLMLHPRDYFYYKLLDKDWVGFAGLPIMYLLAAISMFIPYRVTKDSVDRPDQVVRIGDYIVRRKLSGELLYWLKVKVCERDRLLKACLSPLGMIVWLGAKVRFGSVNNMFKEYFGNDPEHPIVKGLK